MIRVRGGDGDVVLEIANCNRFSMPREEPAFTNDTRTTATVRATSDLHVYGERADPAAELGERGP